MSKLSAPTPITVQHNINDFYSGEATLDSWLKRRALKNQAKDASRCFVICEKKKVIGYYTLSAGAISHEIASKPMRRNMPNPLPALLLGRLAIDKEYHNQGLGSALLRDAMLRSVNVAREAGIFAILVHAISESAKLFYKSRGFIESPLQAMTLMMTMATIKTVLAEK